MDWIIISRIRTALQPWSEQTGIAASVDMDGNFRITPLRIEKRRGKFRIFGTHGKVADVADIQAWQADMVTDAKRHLSKADLKAIWKAKKIATFMPYT